MGLATGEVERRGDDYFGLALNRAARVMTVGHGGQILVSGSTAALLTGFDLRDLGEHRLRDLSGEERLFQVRADGLVDDFPRVRTEERVWARPPPYVELLGRDREVAEVEARLLGRRLVTIVGPGGIGKTALARSALGVQGPGGIVDLTSISTDEAVPGTVASQLGHPSFEALLAAPAPSMPVIVDNCEHVLGGAASTIDRLLSAASDWRILATSRSPLNLAAESVVTLGPLTAPAALELFIVRARDAGSEVDPADSEALQILKDLCRRLDGVPLAIEIAAARSRVVTPAMMLTHMRDGVDVLQRPNFRGPERHRGLRETIAWSYALLDDAEKTALARLSVCEGSFDLSLAAAVIDADTTTVRHIGGTSRVLELLDALVGASLVAVDGLSSTTPYRLLETIRSFALEQLEQADERESTEARFVAHVVERVTTIMERGRSGWSAGVLRELLAEYDNIAAALSSSLQRDTDPTRSLLLCSVLWGVVHNGHVDDVRQLARATLDRWPDPNHPLWPDALAALATASLMLGDVDHAVALAESGLPRASASPFAPATLRRVLGLASQAGGDHDHAAELFAEASTAARASGSTAMAMEADVFGAQALFLAGRPAEALDAVRRARAEAEAVDAQINSIFASIVEGLILVRSDPATAGSVLATALQTSRSSQYPYGVTACLLSLAYTYLRQGRDDAAASTIVELVDEMAASPSDWSRADPLGPVAALMHRRGRGGWQDIAATAEWRARASPLPAAGLHLVDLPAVRGHVLPPRTATDVMLDMLASVCDSPTIPEGPECFRRLDRRVARRRNLRAQR
jgi:predicted ATPase